MTNLDNILKRRDITLPTKVHLAKALFFPVVTYGCESWTIKKAERWKIDAFELWCWRRLLRVPWAARRSNQSIRKEIIPEYSLQGLMLKLKLQYFGYLMWRTDSLENILMLGRIEGRSRRGWQRRRLLGGITDSMDKSWVNSGSWWRTGSLVCCSPLGHKESDTTEWLKWTELIVAYNFSYIVGFDLIYLFTIFTSMFMRDIVCLLFLFTIYLSGYGVREMLALKDVLKFPPPVSVYLIRLYNIGIILFI